MSEVKVNKISPRSGTNVQLGDSGDTITIPSGVTLANSGTIDNLNASNLTSGTVSSARVSGAYTGITQTGTLTSLTSTGLTLQEIATTKSDTAVDVFIYDTRKDSDGGAWRKRTQNTSWYNETLNTATRGSRKEFPAIAVIVAEINKVTIYDGDDPSLPMWMVFNAGTYSYIRGSGDVNKVTALNGILVASGNLNGFSVVDFIADRNPISLYSGAVSNLKIALPVSGRNNTSSSNRIDSNYPPIVNTVVNDVAMTVLPNAPIDNDTGLPVPTIAVGTDDGVSVFKDDGTVVDITFSSYGTINLIDFIDVDKIIFNSDSGSRNRIIKVYSIPTSDISEGTGYLPNNALESYEIEQISSANELTFFSGVGSTNFLRKLVKRNFGQERGLTKVSPNIETPSNGMVANITSDHNTGWMNGDIKLATLSDTDDTSITGSELLNQDGTEWYLPSGFTMSSGTFSYDGTNGLYLKPSDRLSGLTVGQTYTVSFNLTAITGGTTIWVVVHDSGSVTGNHGGVNLSSTGIYSFTFKAETTQDYIVIQNNSATQTFTITDFSVRLAVPDRSYNNKGLQVFGTIGKTPVATGADLVAYSGFSASNYLEQPYNSGLDFGTGDFSIMGWVKHTGFISNQHSHIFARQNPEAANEWSLQYNTTGELVFRSAGAERADAGALTANVWTNICVVRTSGTLNMYINGVLKDSAAFAGDISNAVDATPLRVGGRNAAYAGSWGGSLALLRISATAPTAEQVAKIYNDEKFLFQENAKATLYGTSNDVVALAYDDTTKLLHAGTSNGRSVFNGLRRVDNTTDAVGTSISASNGLVVDE